MQLTIWSSQNIYASTLRPFDQEQVWHTLGVTQHLEGVTYYLMLRRLHRGSFEYPAVMRGLRDDNMVSDLFEGI